MNPALLADIVVAVHFCIVLFVLLGQIAIVIGGPLRWKFVRNLWFRLLHLAIIGFVATQGAAGAICPFTRWENELRIKAGLEGHDGTFVGRLLHDLLFVDVPQPTLDQFYIGFAVVVLLCLFLWPPRWPRKRRDEEEGSAA